MILVNGELRTYLDATDRGLHYGDGLFETIAVRNGKPQLWQAHLVRLGDGCARLGIPFPDSELLASEAAQLCAGADRAVLKIILTRGSGGRGYRAPQTPEPTRLLLRYPWPEQADEPTPYTLRLCRTPLSCNPLLAGIKHLNRLEQVLARNEWDDESIQEGVMADADGRLIEGTSSNLFAVRGGVLLTPDVSRCGVDGVMRRQVLALAKALAIPCEVGTLHQADMAAMDEVFVTNSILGIRPVARFEQFTYGDNPLTRRLMEALQKILEGDA